MSQVFAKVQQVAGKVVGLGDLPLVVHKYNGLTGHQAIYLIYKVLLVPRV